MSADARFAAKLNELGLQPPPPPVPKGAYKVLKIVGNMAYISGHVPVTAAGDFVTGKVGADLDVEAGYKAAQLTAVALLSSVRNALGSLDRVHSVVKVLGMVNCTPDFTQQPAVINGCSDLLAAVFGADAGSSARSAIGVYSLPLGVPIEIEAIFEIE
jgi:enamine deaminase RidA (YjgF/YER057c/UK114 family)